MQHACHVGLQVNSLLPQPKTVNVISESSFPFNTILICFRQLRTVASSIALLYNYKRQFLSEEKKEGQSNITTPHRPQ